MPPNEDILMRSFFVDRRMMQVYHILASKLPAVLYIVEKTLEEKMKKLFMMVVLGFCGITMIFGGGKQQAGGANAQKPVALEILIWNDQEPYIRAVIEAYQKTKNTQFNITTVPADSEEYDNKLTVMLSGNANVDILGVKGTAQLTQYRDTGSLLEITDRIKQSPLDISRYGAIYSNITRDGRYFALPMRSTCWVLYYNRKMFDDAGIKYPGQMTWNEYGELAKALTKGERTNKIWGGYWVAWPGVLNFFASQQNSYLTDENLSPLKANLELFNRFYNVDKSHMSVAEMSSTGSNWLGEFENGNAAMLPNGEWVIGSILQDEAAGKTNVQWEIAPMPVPDDVAPGTTIGSLEFMGINAASKNKDEAFEFLSFLCGEQGAEIYASMGLIPGYSSDKTSAAFKKAVNKDSASVFFDAKKIQADLDTPRYNEIINAYAEHAELYLIGEKNIDETMRNFTAQRATILRK
jgi:multiple sugar transport system substrate-binding protein